MRKYLILTIAALAALSCKPSSQTAVCDLYTIDGELDTLYYEQAPFDPEYMDEYKMRDNGRQEVVMTCEDAMEAIKGLDAITLGLPKIVYLVGWQYNGHDSKYPAFFEGNEALKRPGDSNALESLKWVMEEAKAYNTAVSLHVNMFDCYTDSPLFDEYVKADVLAKDKDGKLLHGDWGYKVSYTAEWEKGLTKKRLDSLISILPIADAGTFHIDAFHNTLPTPYREDGENKIKGRKVTLTLAPDQMVVIGNL